MGEGWWEASDGNWYPPNVQPRSSTNQLQKLSWKWWAVLLAVLIPIAILVVMGFQAEYM